MLPRRTLVAVALLAGLAPAEAEKLIGMIAIHGTCEELIVRGRTETGRCWDKITSSNYDDGRTGFYFILSQTEAVAFSGFSAPTSSDDVGHIRLDRMVLKAGDVETPAEVVPVHGTCDFGNPYLGVASITCRAKAADGGRFSVRFRSDGTPPK